LPRCVSMSEEIVQVLCFPNSSLVLYLWLNITAARTFLLNKMLDGTWFWWNWNWPYQGS
jgi:hypothetical protein